MSKVVLFGHSHLGAIVRAYDDKKTKAETTLDLYPIQCIRKGVPHIVHGQNGWEYHPDGIAELRSVIETVKPSAVFFSLQGEQAIWAGMLTPERPFDFFFPGDSPVVDGVDREVVPFDIIMDIAIGHHRLAADFLGQVQSLVTIPFFGISPPPPVGDTDFMMERLRGHDVYPKLKERGLASKAWRRKMWRVHVLALAEIYRTHRCGFREAPDNALDREGFLPASMYGDAFHANNEYGALILEQMLQTAN
jgi:hypothetical protein